MATVTLQTKNSVFKVHNYTLDLLQDIGQGAYGIVFFGKDEENRPVAAKRIDAKRHPGVLTGDLNKLLKLNDPYIVKIYDIHHHDNKFWMFMELCPDGDLSKFCSTTSLNVTQKLRVMWNIAYGVHYLHDNNIIHRDIKPANILVKNKYYLHIKLADFDISKCLDPDYETSVMSSNVGTNAFKAPEFFTRVDGKLQYHRNVDIYAMGLTFLALIQAKGNPSKLIPRIETPRDGSEFHVQSIGQLIAERIKYGVGDLDVVRVREVSEQGQYETLEDEVRKVIRRMTHHDPQQRPSVLEVSCDLIARLKNP